MALVRKWGTIVNKALIASVAFVALGTGFTVQVARAGIITSSTGAGLYTPPTDLFSPTRTSSRNTDRRKATHLLTSSDQQGSGSAPVRLVQEKGQVGP